MIHFQPGELCVSVGERYCYNTLSMESSDYNHHDLVSQWHCKSDCKSVDFCQYKLSLYTMLSYQC